MLDDRKTSSALVQQGELRIAKKLQKRLDL
jgi:hypothetical protein